MAYTFGAATGDDISHTTFSAGGNNTVSLFMGWFYPTTLTATRGLFSWSTVFGAEIDTTTSELRLRTDNTTDGQWTTTGVGLTLNEWKFIAVAATCSNTGPTAQWLVFSGTDVTAPSAVTVTQATAPAGNFVGSSSFTVGNRGVATQAFQGDIGPYLVVSQTTISGTTVPLPTQNAGSFTQSESDIIKNAIILPFWMGNQFPARLRTSGATNSSYLAAFVNLDLFVPVTQEVVTNTGDPFRGLTINGVTPSQNKSPRGYQTPAAQPWGGRPLSRR